MFGVVTRLTDLIFRLQDLAPAARAGSGAQQQGSSLVVAGCDIVTPNSAAGPRVLARNLSFTLSVGDPRGHLAVTGPSGCGKSALCRVVSGLWALPAGTIALPTSTDGEPAALHFVPQKLLVLTAPESLRDFVTYPTSLSEDEFAAAEADIRRDLATLKLVRLVDREGWETKRFWHERLSLGEMQSLAMARLLFHRPRLAVLGEHGHLQTNASLFRFLQLGAVVQIHRRLLVGDFRRCRGGSVRALRGAWHYLLLLLAALACSSCALLRPRVETRREHRGWLVGASFG